MPSWLYPLIPLAAGAAAALVMWLRHRRQEQERQRREAEARQRQAGRSRPSPGGSGPLGPENIEPTPGQRIDRVKEILSGDPRVAQRLLQQAGLDHRDPQDVSRDRAAVEEIARTIPDWMIETLRLASSQEELHFDLQRQSVRQPVNYPTADMEPEPMGSIDQLPSTLPEYQLESEDQYYGRLAQQDMLVQQSYEENVNQKLLYILLDVSGSMDTPMVNGLPRHVWARGVTVNLLLKAVDGQAKYFLRTFDSRPHDLSQATTPAEADHLVDFILNSAFSGGGTNIEVAITTAINDIRTKGGDISQSEVLLISDGESPMDVDEIQRRLGSDIRLHIVLLGNADSALRRIAASFRTLQ